MSIAGKLTRAAAAVVPALPFGVASGIGRALGTCAWALDARHRHVADANLSRAFPQSSPRERRRLTRRSFQQAGRTAIEMLWSRCLDGRALERAAGFEGLEHIEQALGRGQGLILISAHFGNWELMGVALALVGVPVSVVTRPLPDEELEGVLCALRTRTGGQLIRKERAVRRSIKAIRANQAVGVFIDQNTLLSHACFVPFFGVEAATTPLAGLLHVRTLAPMVTVFCVPDAGRYRFVIEPLEVEPGTGDLAKQVTFAATRRIEAYVRDHPEAWLWIHDRWRTRPERSEGRATPRANRNEQARDVLSGTSREVAAE